MSFDNLKRFRFLIGISIIFISSLVGFRLLAMEAIGNRPEVWAVEITGIYDGDTFNFKAAKLPTSLQKMKVRIRGIDAPELGKRGKCDDERKKAEDAKKKLIEIIGVSKVARLTNMSWDKYGSRIVADVEINGKDVGKIMIREGLAEPYFGSGKKTNWCEIK